MYNKENRFRMWTFMFLYILTLNIRQVAGDDSTQMLYVKLTVDESVLRNLTLPSPFTTNEVNVDGFKMTTMCEPQLNGSTKCDCKLNHVWSDRACQSTQKCCGNQTCTFNQNSSHMCISNTEVTIKGFITLKGPRYENCLAQHSSADFISCDMNLTEEMSEVFSTLKGFDVLKIMSYSVGSVIANFELTIANSIMPQDLMQKSQILTRKLSASLNVMTLGVVQLISPPNPVCYYWQYNVSCSVQGDPKNKPLWQLLKQDSIFEITNGTGSEVTTTNGSTVTLKNITEFWAGVYTCTYSDSMSTVTIAHTASTVMDVSTLPNIDITTDPGFPRCKQATDLVKVRIICDIGISSEPYTVTWTSLNTKAELNEVKSGSPRYAVDTYVSCNSYQTVPEVTCTFTNRCSQNQSASVKIIIIYVGDLFCESDDDWKDTKVGYVAVIKCQNAHGTRQRTCKNTTPAQWEQEESNCVNLDLKSVLQSAITADSGLGSLDANAANVFSRLQNATNNTEAINTYANMDASVNVLITLSQKLNIINNESSVDDLLGSSSNLLEKCLDESWQAKAGSGNISLAERYLSAVEQLIEVTNITGAKNKTNVEVATCNDTQAQQCTNSVFNVTVLLSSSSAGSAKTTGFKNLVSFFPKNNETYVPNSIIVSTTTQINQLDSVNIQIDFPLLQKRPRNVEMKCVTWDNASRSWSSTGCSWKGPSHEERCVCSHLSSFAILMSQKPLEIYWVNELTYIGLSVSVLSLIINLAIEVAVWSAVVKTSTLHLRHTAHVNISLCLLVADGCFLASLEPKIISDFWCVTSVVLKHFCYLAMFFWMFALSSTLLHQAVFMFHNVSKKNYLRFSYLLGYVCPLLIVTAAFLSNGSGARGQYYSPDTCWLLYSGLFRGSIHTFLIPVGIIVLTNVFSMVIVIILLLNHPDSTAKPNEKTAAKTVMRTVILLTPIFGVTWIFGFFVMSLDLTYGYVAYAVNYLFTLLNAFQGLFILLTACLGDRLTREALLKRLRKNASASTSNSTTKLDSTGTK